MTDKVDLELITKSLKRLKEIIAQETVYLRENKIKAIDGLYHEKLTLLQNLENQKKLLKLKSSPLDRNSELAQHLIKLGKEIDSTLQVYGKELIKAREVNKCVMNAITQALEEHFKKVGSYNAKGRDSQYLPKGESSVPPMRVNETF